MIGAVNEKFDMATAAYLPHGSWIALGISEIDICDIARGDGNILNTADAEP